MKRLILTIAIFLIHLTAFSQDVLKFRSTDAAIRVKDVTDLWKPWIKSETGEGILIVLDTERNKLTIYGVRTSELSIINHSIDKSKENVGVVSHLLNSVDEKGDKCLAVIVYYDAANKQKMRDLLLLYDEVQLKFGLTSD